MHKVRPVSKKSKFGYLQVGVETYGGGIWHSWFDRDLSLAGRVVLSNKGGGYTSKLIKIDRPLLRVPTLAIHCAFQLIGNDFNRIATQLTWLFHLVDRGVNEGFKFNREAEFVPIAGLVEKELNADKEKSAEKQTPSATSIRDNHHPAVLAVLAEELSVSAEEIHDFELYVSVARAKYVC